PQVARSMSEEFGPAFGTPGDQRLFARKLPAFDLPLRAVLSARYIECEPASAAVIWIFRLRKPRTSAAQSDRSMRDRFGGGEEVGDVIARMLGNVALDGVFGAVPLVGDAFDVLWRANRRNVLLLREWLDHERR